MFEVKIQQQHRQGNRRSEQQKISRSEPDRSSERFSVVYSCFAVPSKVCLEECSRIELLNLYRQWKKGQLISMLPIVDFYYEDTTWGKSIILSSCFCFLCLLVFYYSAIIVSHLFKTVALLCFSDSVWNWGFNIDQNQWKKVEVFFLHVLYWP